MAGAAHATPTGAGARETSSTRTVLTLFALPVTPTSKYSAAMVHRMQEYGHTQNRV
jgi:hypothetical protein